MATSSRPPEPDQAEPPQHQFNLVGLAQRIREKRIERRLTIEQLAAKTQLSRSWLSKVENFRVTPSLPALFQIAANLGVTLAELVEGIEDVPHLCVVRKGDGKPVDRNPSPDNNTRYESLADQHVARAMEPFLLTIPPRGGRSECLPHEGEEFLMVLAGQAGFEYGEESVFLDEGDCIYFDGGTPHRVFNPSDRESRVLCVFFVTN